MSKADDCKVIYARLLAEHTQNGVVDYKSLRTAAIAAFISEAGCTTAGAATYYANNKNRGGATGSYIQRGNGHAGNSFVGGNESKEPDSRQLYSAVQLTKDKKVGAVAAFFHAQDAMDRAKIVRGICVLGAPEIGESVETLSLFDDTILNTADTANVSVS